MIALGAYLGHSGFMPERKAIWANQLIYWIALPCLLFLETAKTDLDLTRGGNTLIVVLGGMVVCILIGYFVAGLMKLPTASRGAFVQAGFRGNLAYIGIPVVVYSVGQSDSTAIGLSMLVVAGTIPFYNVAAILVLLTGHRAFSLNVVATVITNLIKNPLIIACVAGLGVSNFEWEMPLSVTRTLEPLGRMALPLALLSIGVTIDFRKIRGVLTPVLTASIIKIAVSPLIGWILGYALGLGNDEMRIALIMLATPTASASFIMADLLRSDSQMTSGVIVVSTLLSLIPMMIITWVFSG